jgi:uncharacterized membrane protein
MTYAIVAYILTGILWLAYIGWVSGRLKRALGASPKP